jgi:murein DD-endopeptidase MepM/ murein hydrolase activator NlpD
VRTRLPRRLALATTGVVAVALLTPAAAAASPDVEEARQEVAQLGAEVEAASAEYAAVEARLHAQQNQVAAAEARVAAQATLVQMLQAQVVDLAVETYKSGGVDPQLSLLATGSTELSGASGMLGLLAERRAVTLTDVRDATRRAGTSPRRDEGRARGRLRRCRPTSPSAAPTSRPAWPAPRTSSRSPRPKRSGSSPARRPARPPRRREAAPAEGPPVPPSRSPPVSSGELATPSPGRQSPWGMRVHPVYGDRRHHSGMDIITGCGTPVVAAADGVVESADWEGSYGNILVLRHGVSSGGELSTAYAHLEEFVVKKGSVTRGQLIGYVGTTGLSTGCHLHFEVRIDGKDVDPAGFI